jgi:hypothetical protein
MWASARAILSFLVLAAISNAQDVCTIGGLTETNIVDGIRIARGSVTFGSAVSNLLLFQPISATVATPPILFSHSDVAIADARTDLRPIAVRLARRGASVLVLERVVHWEPGDNTSSREPGLIDCAADWLLSQPSMDVLHAVYVGPKLKEHEGSRGRPLAFTKIKPTRRGNLWVPLAETDDEAVGITKAESQDRLVELIAGHMVMDVTAK